MRADLAREARPTGHLYRFHGFSFVSRANRPTDAVFLKGPVAEERYARRSGSRPTSETNQTKNLSIDRMILMPTYQFALRSHCSRRNEASRLKDESTVIRQNMRLIEIAVLFVMSFSGCATSKKFLIFFKCIPACIIVRYKPRYFMIQDICE